jgi:curved DNA-binding protein CbpA
MRLDRQVLESDLYALLVVSETARREEIRAAYRRLAVERHPDRNPRDRARAEQLMAELNVAASVLLDPPSRVAYDRARDKERRRRAEPAPSSAKQPMPNYVEDSDLDWVPAGDPQRARSRGDADELVARMRPCVARGLSQFAAEVQSWSVRRHAVLLAVCVLSAFELIALAQPRSLGFAETASARSGRINAR